MEPRAAAAIGRFIAACQRAWNLFRRDGHDTHGSGCQHMTAQQERHFSLWSGPAAAAAPLRSPSRAGHGHTGTIARPPHVDKPVILKRLAAGSTQNRDPYMGMLSDLLLRGIRS